MASLVQQRMAIERHRAAGLVFLTLGGVWALIVVIAGVATSWSWNPWIQIVLGLLWIGTGLISLRRYRREIRLFTDEHGTEAGKR